MKKVSIFMAIAAAASLASCTAQSPKANLSTELDSLSYSIGMAQTQGLKGYLTGRLDVDTAYMADFIKGLNEGANKTSKKDIAYMAGLQIGQQISNQMMKGINQELFAGDSTKTISKANFMAGFIAGTLEKGGMMTMEEAQTYTRTAMETIKAKALAEKYADYKAENEKFLADNKTKEGVKTTPSGLQYKVITEGKGEIPADTCKVKVNYKGTLIDGTEFDSSYKRKEPATFRANQVIKGWTEALTMMPVGSKWELYIPQELAYGARESGNQIKPFSTLIFEVELVGIEKRLDHAPHELSGGQKQRVSLAGVMVDQVKILMFDEPLASLDPATGKQAIELIDEIQHKTDTTVLIIEHRLEDVLWRNVDRIILVNEGTILADLRPDELLATHMLAENGIREPLYLTAMRYAGIAITPEKRPAHVDTVVLDDADTARLHKWFNALPLPEPGPAPEHLLEVRGLGFGYTKGQSTLHDISLSIGKGEMVSIVGRNGAGKSTLAKLICGFETPEQGQVLLNGRDLAQDNIRRRAQHIGYVMQNPNQMISKTMIFEEVALALQGSDMTQEQICQRVEDTLKVCGLYPFRNWPISALSFGQKKRVTIASVLVQQPELIILDEPTAGQDFRHYTDIMEFLRGLNEQGVTVVMITHDMHLMLEYTPRALVFCDGQLIADRSAAAVLCDPELIEQAALKETSLFTLANRCGIAPAEDFVERFIHEDREVRTHGC